MVMAESMEDLITMLDGLSRASQEVGLKMNMNKTKVMVNVHVAPTPVTAPRRNFLRRTKATSPPDTVQTPTDNTETTTNKYTRRGNSKFNTRKEVDKTVEKNEIDITRRPLLNGGARRSERPPVTRKFAVRRRPGGVNATTPIVPTATPSSSSTTRRPFRIGTRRRVVNSSTSSTTTTTSTAPTTTAFEDEESLQDIDDTDAIEDPTLEAKDPQKNFKIQRRPLVTLKNTETDQNPQATNEEQNKRQSKKFSASIKPNELVDLLKRSREGSSTQAGITIEDFSPETAVAIAAHQLLAAPIPVVPDFNDDGIVPTRKTQTTVEYQYTSREYNEYTNNGIPNNNDSTRSNYETTSYKSYNSNKDINIGTTGAPDYESTKAADFDITKTTADRYPTTLNYKNDYSTFDSPKITTYDVPKPTKFPSTANIDSEYTRTTENLYTYPKRFDEDRSYLPKSTTSNFPTELVSKISPTYVPKFTPGYANTVNQEYVHTTAPTTFDSTLTENSLPRISTTLSPPISKTFDRTASTLLISSDDIKPRKAFTSEVTPNVVTAGYSGIQRGLNKYRNEKLIPVPVVDTGYSTVGYTEESAHFTREYLLESPVTKTYDEEYQYLYPVTSPQTPTKPVTTRKVIKKKVQRKISTTQSPTAAPTTTTLKPRRVPAKPFEKVPSPAIKKHRPIANYDYYDENEENVAVKYAEGTKVVMHENGVIECLDIGNFPHPISCKKFISCARIDNGSLLGWEYICPKGLSFDPVGGICNWSAGLGCNEKDA